MRKKEKNGKERGRWMGWIKQQRQHNSKSSMGIISSH
jgi:hypothetical protein